MRKNIICLLFPLFIATSANGQNDIEAVKILDKFSSIAHEAPSVSMKFDLIKSDLMEKSVDTIKGSVILSRDKYRLDTGDNITWFNGETIWNYLTVEKEVTITKAEKKGNSFQNHPSAIFSMYKKGYKRKLVEEKPDSYIIDLYPEDIKSDLIRVRLFIGKSLMDLKCLEYKQKDGILLTLNVKEYNLKVKPESDTFIFQPAKFHGVEINDMR